jgi:TRAP-type mannitol/chloroaromatic compound transport system substrate-binding protein
MVKRAIAKADAKTSVTTKLVRRRFLLAGLSAGLGGAAAVAMPQVSRAQTVNWRIQSAWPAREIFHEFAVDYAKRIAAMTSGRLRIDVLAAGSVVPPLQMADAVHAGILDGCHGTASLWYKKHKAYALFGAPPSFGWDSHSFLAWFYYGGGEALYQELANEILRVNLVGLLYGPMPTQALGWFKKEVKNPGDLKGVRYRGAGLSGELFAALGATLINVPASQVTPFMERDLIDATDSSNPVTDLQLGLPNVAKFYVMGSHHRQVEAFEIVFNKSKYDPLSAELKAIIRHAAFSASSEQAWNAHSRFSKDFDEIRKRGVNVVKTSPEIIQQQLKIWDQLIAEHSKDSFFAKVIASQKAWVKRTGPFFQLNNLGSEDLGAAYQHFFG